MTDSFFARVDGATPIYCLFARDNDFVGYCCYITNSDLVMLEENDHSKMNGGGCSYTYTQGQWFHVAMVISETTMTIYIDKTKAKEITLSSPMEFSLANAKNLYLGRFGNRWYYTNGALDNIKMYNRALLEPEIDALADRKVSSIAISSQPSKTNMSRAMLLILSEAKLQ